MMRPVHRETNVHAPGGRGARRGFTLIELLVVILIILLVSAVALATVLPALNNRQASEAGRILQGALVGARDKAIHDGQPAGIRLLPDPTVFSVQPATLSDGTTPNPQAGWVDPTQPLAYNRLIPIEPAPEYSEGMVTTIPVSAVQAQGAGASAVTISPGITFSWASMPAMYSNFLVVVGSPTDPKTGLPTSPTSWFWNVRVGDRIQINNAGAWYTVVGPTQVLPAGGNAEMFVNVGTPGALSTSIVPTINGTAVEFLVLVNGRDDNGNGWIDDGWDGVDNNGDPNDTVDEYAVVINSVTYTESEPESWLGALANTPAVNVPYTIQRRPSPTFGSREIALPTGMVIDATTWKNTTKERSRLPVNLYNGMVEIMVNPDGTVFYSLPYGVPSSVGMDQTFYHFWLAERQDVATPDPNQTAVPYLPLPEGVAATAGVTAPQTTLKGNFSLLTLFARTGQVVVSPNPPFLHDTTVGFNNQTGSYNANNPYIPAEQGATGGP